MDENEIEQLFDQKIEAGFSAYIKNVSAMDASEIIEKAEEIAATKLVYSELLHKADSDSIEYLVQFENPLEIVRDKWLEEHNVPVDNEMDHVLWSVRNYQDAEQNYALDEGVTM